jgi:hypothetical protein
MVFTMKYAMICAALVASVFSLSPASAKVMSCSGADLSKMTTMIGGTPDGPNKWEMNKHLAMVNSAMAKDGMRGCDITMKTMMKGSKMSMNEVRDESEKLAEIRRVGLAAHLARSRHYKVI